MKASISAAVMSSGASTGCKAVVRTAGRLRQDWRVADDEPKQKGLDDGKPGCISRRDGDRRAVKESLERGRSSTPPGACEHETPPAFVSQKNKTQKSPLQPTWHFLFLDFAPDGACLA